MTFAILFVSIVILACLVGNRISNRIGVPMLLIFIVLGMFFGSDGVIRISFENFELAEQICSIALIFIMFYGGFGTKWSAAKPIALRAVILSTAGVVLTAGRRIENTDAASVELISEPIKRLSSSPM